MTFKKIVSAALLLFSIMFQAFPQDIYEFPPDTTIYGRNAKVGKYFNIRGFNMYYEVYGKGEPLLIIHGNGGSISNFFHQIPFFAQHYKVIVADSRSQGKSIDKGDSLSYEMMADDFSGLLDHLKIDSCMVIGWSDGGNNGLLLAIRHPEKVRKLAVTGANLWPDTSAVDPVVYKFVVENIDQAKKLPQTDATRNSLKLLYLLNQQPQISLSELKKIKCPTLVIAGDHDVIVTKHTLLIAESIPRSYLWILPNSGHSTPLVYKDQFNRVVLDFFKKPYRNISGTQRFM